MSIGNKKFDPKSPKVVTRKFTFWGVNREKGETFPAEGEEVQPVFIRRLFNARLIEDEPVDVIEETETETPKPKRQTRKRKPSSKKVVVEEETDNTQDSAPWNS